MIPLTPLTPPPPTHTHTHSRVRRQTPPPTPSPFGVFLRRTCTSLAHGRSSWSTRAMGLRSYARARWVITRRCSQPSSLAVTTRCLPKPFLARTGRVGSDCRSLSTFSTPTEGSLFHYFLKFIVRHSIKYMQIYHPNNKAIDLRACVAVSPFSASQRSISVSTSHAVTCLTNTSHRCRFSLMYLVSVGARQASASTQNKDSQLCV
jgi:hypothetical protein